VVSGVKRDFACTLGQALSACARGPAVTVTLSECLINGRMSPWSRGGARGGCAEMGGRGPCVF
jgi:hypothetical protein